MHKLGAMARQGSKMGLEQRITRGASGDTGAGYKVKNDPWEWGTVGLPCTDTSFKVILDAI